MLKILLSILIVLNINLFSQDKYLHHNILAKVEPKNSTLSVEDEITFSANSQSSEISFEMNSDLVITKVVGAKIENLGTKTSQEDLGMDREKHQQVMLNNYKITLQNPTNRVIKLFYEGKINSTLVQSEENYQRGFSESAGIISEIGVYLAGSTFWVPNFEEKLFTFTLKTELPEGWKSVSQGERIFHENNISVWNSPEPQEEVFLIAAKFWENSKDVGSVKAMSFLRTQDDALSQKYLETTAQYLEMYRNLVGVFPYKKFALVENFWETGYGMPSFTLLGEKIIRFPFILHSSYPHELLHNWWGNSVYVDFEKGNWCEGITAYMADHLIKEQRGQGAEHRRAILQRFTDFVNETNDFPAIQFISRFDGASEAIGYGKTAMLWHTIRKEIGDDNFVKAFQQFNRNYKYKFATFGDIQSTFQKIVKNDVDYLFEDLLYKKGAAEISVKNAVFDENTLKITLSQNQKGDLYRLNIPIVIYYQNKLQTEKAFLSEKEQTFSFNISEKPIKIEVDPEFDIFRKLDPNEIPPSFSKIFGSTNVSVILPEKDKIDYSQIADNWMKEKQGKIFTENSISEIPTNEDIWVFGNSNKYLDLLKNEFENMKIAISDKNVEIFEKSIPKENHSFVIAIKNPKNPERIIVWLATENQKAIDGLIRKLPHYGKYSYLAFEGDEPENTEKGEFPSFNSPMVYYFDKNAKSNAKIVPAKALAYLNPVFSEENMINDIKELSSEKMLGRGIDNVGIELAKKYITEQFEKIGLKHGFENSFHQTWNETIKDKNLTLTNIVGYLPGKNDSLKNSPLIISAHYDHLGTGFPYANSGNEGKIHPGADDNASGIAVLLELARSLKESNFERPIYFVAFTAEESGLVGSRYFIKNLPKEIAKEGIIANLNFDTVGRLFQNKLIIINSESAREWRFIFMGTDYVTGIPTELIKEKLDASDQVAFLENGIPAIQFFSGANKDYHKPSDTIEKIDKSGLVKVATVGKEVAEYLANRKEPLTFTGEIKSSETKSAETTQKTQPTQNTNRSVKTGIVPDFSFSDGGVRVSDVYENSSAEMVEIKVGDIITAIDGNKISNLREYSNKLKEYRPGQKVEFTILRDGKELKKKLILEEK